MGSRRLMSAGLLAFAVLTMGQAAPRCEAMSEGGPAATPTPTGSVATAAPKTTAAPATATPAATAAPKTATLASPTAASSPTAAAGTTAAASTFGWDHPPLAVQFALAPPYLSVGVVCAKNLPPGARVRLNLSGAAGPPATAEGVVAADGSVSVLFGVQRAAEVIWEFDSLTPVSGTVRIALPAGGRATVTLPADKPC